MLDCEWNTGNSSGRFRLEREIEGNPMIRCTQSVRRGFGASVKEGFFDILVMAEGMGKFYFQLEGIKGDETEISKMLLDPIFRPVTP